jgi:predicted TIM-barrel fold metal-dependent hydrolase
VTAPGGAQERALLSAGAGDARAGRGLFMPAGGVVDYLCNAFLPTRAALWARSIADQKIPLKVRTDPDDGFTTADAMTRRMDRLGVASLLVPVIDHRPPNDESRPVDFEDVAADFAELDAMVAGHPGRFFGLYAIGHAPGVAGVRAAESALARPEVAGMYLHVHSFDRPFDHADWYPYYDLADRLGVTVVMQAGTSGGRMPSECGRPIGIDRPAIYFPDTVFVLSHTGYPWVDEAVAMAQKFSNVYLGTGSWPPHRWAPSLVDFIRWDGRTKVVFGTNFPTVGHRHALERLGRLELPDESLAGLLGDNARRAFRRITPPPTAAPTT